MSTADDIRSVKRHTRFQSIAQTGIFLELSKQSDELAKLSEATEAILAFRKRDSEIDEDASSWRESVARLAVGLSKLDSLEGQVTRAVFIEALFNTACRAGVAPTSRVSAHELILAKEQIERVEAARKQMLAELAQHDDLEAFLNAKLQEALPAVREATDALARYDTALEKIATRLDEPITEKDFSLLVAENNRALAEVEARLAKVLETPELAALVAWQQQLGETRAPRNRNLWMFESRSISSLLERAQTPSKTEAAVAAGFLRVRELTGLKTSLRKQYRAALVESDDAKVDEIRRRLGNLDLFAEDAELRELERLHAPPPRLPLSGRIPANTALGSETPPPQNTASRSQVSKYCEPYRSSDERWSRFGVCGGLAHKWGVRPFWLRMLLIGATIVPSFVVAVSPTLSPAWGILPLYLIPGLYLYRAATVSAVLATKGLPRPVRK